MLWTGFILGLFGGMHCAGMCGPIALAIPVKEGVWANVLHKSLYNLGRIFTYSLFGLVAGLIGQGFTLAGWQQIISIILGILLILLIVFTGSANLNLPTAGFLQRFTSILKGYFKGFISRRSMSSALALGLINGFLPCGLVYVALAASLPAGNIQDSVIYMMVFGLGTFPVMLGISLLGNFIKPVIRRKIYKVVPLFVVILGLLFILRGLNLGIPYVSPKLDSNNHTHGQIEVCDH